MAFEGPYLIMVHLVPKHKHPNERQAIQELDIYRSDPWDLLVSAVADEDYCFFTKRTETRSTDEGYWQLTQGDEDVIWNSNEVIGIKNTCQYYVGKSGVGKKTDWFLNEYRLDPNFRAQLNLPNDTAEYIICELYSVDDTSSSSSASSTASN